MWQLGHLDAESRIHKLSHGKLSLLFPKDGGHGKFRLVCCEHAASYVDSVCIYILFFALTPILTTCR